ncbi:D-hexose-6-phosphate mutarotase [Chromohalobacter sp. HP20-39]|uniref:D-hexose-6-phosphate mutarotase n=1 Tax=Chromohalobacter sp. HP20-39 TaxID=3079306 RepID=UPI00294B1DB9|nr:D-hexose-6-phosphate mutarotase [Chromohalobacter sp. HP20-39]MDV6319321.1 D-hexose-6-phosphate mutarotase [Chromohalobacter sp. HP20-39]
MIPDSLRQLLDATQGQREAEWQGRRVLLFNADWGELAVSLQGAQVLHFRPASEHGDGWLWVTSTPQAVPGTIRGGIPVCWPWFADESPDGRGPMHGTARQAEWRLDGVDDEDEGVEVHFSPTTRLDEQLTPRVVIHASARRLHVELITEHLGETPVKLTAALHTYFTVAHAHQCRIEGLAGARYLDKRLDFSEAHQQGELGVRGPLDRIYESNRPLVLDDGVRRFKIAKQGSDSTVVWHPDTDLPGDTPTDAGHRFLCVEAACTRIDPVWLVPGAQHLLATTLTHEDMPQ